jgi:BolA protein
MPDPGTIERMTDQLQVLAPQLLQIEDESALHAGHEGAKSGGGHYRMRLVSDRFRGLSRVARHRLVYDALELLMRREIHALAMTLQSPDELPAGPATPSPEGH